MHGHHIVGVFRSRDAAEQARAKLISSGVKDEDIHLSSEDAGQAEEQDTGSKGGFFDWLFGTSSDRDWYRSNVKGGRTALSVYADEGTDTAWYEDQLSGAGAIEFEDDDMTGRDKGVSFSGQGGGPGTESARPATGQAETEGVIPFTKEQLEAGKITAEARQRLRARVVERPVEASVNLTDERVIIERRPASGMAASESGLQDRDVEIIERHEEPVVSKSAETKEEVAIKKQVQQRTEKVRDKVRETKVEVEGEGGTSPASGEPMPKR